MCVTKTDIKTIQSAVLETNSVLKAVYTMCDNFLNKVCCMLIFAWRGNLRLCRVWAEVVCLSWRPELYYTPHTMVWGLPLTPGDAHTTRLPSRGLPALSHSVCHIPKLCLAIYQCVLHIPQVCHAFSQYVLNIHKYVSLYTCVCLAFHKCISPIVCLTVHKCVLLSPRVRFFSPQVCFTFITECFAVPQVCFAFTSVCSSQWEFHISQECFSFYQCI